MKLKQVLFLVASTIFAVQLHAQCLEGSGTGTIKSFDLAPVKGIKILAGVSEGKITEGATQSINVSIDDNLVDSLDIYTTDGILTISFKDSLCLSNYTLDLNIVVPDLESIEFLGSGLVNISDFTSTDSLTVTLAGSGNIEIGEYGNAAFFEVKNLGSGSISMTKPFPELKGYEVTSAGSGNYYGCAFEVETCVVKNLGSGLTAVHADSLLDVELLGSGTVEYFGAPKNITQNNLGTGKVTAKELSDCSIVTFEKDDHHSRPSYTCIEGSGTSTTKPFDAAPFLGIKVLAGLHEAQITEGATQSINVSIDDNLVDSLDIYTTDGILTISFKDSLCLSNYTLDLNIVVPDLESIEFLGSGTISVGDFSATEQLTVKNMGSGDITIGAYKNATYLTVQHMGSGNISMNQAFPRLSQYEITNSGSGSYFGCSLHVDECTVKSLGSGFVAVSASSVLNIELLGSGNVEYYGSPNTLTKTQLGSGSIEAGTSPNCRQITTGNGQFSGNNPLLIYPNPSESQLFITGLDKAKACTLTNLHGQQLMEFIIPIEGKLLSIEHLPKGMYLLYIDGASSKIIKK